MRNDIEKQVHEIFAQTRGMVVRESDLLRNFNDIANETFSAKQKLYMKTFLTPLTYFAVARELLRNPDSIKSSFTNESGKELFTEMDVNEAISILLEKASPFKKLQRKITLTYAEAAKGLKDYMPYVKTGALVRLDERDSQSNNDNYDEHTYEY